MAYIDLYEISKRYDIKDIFKEVSFHLKEGERVSVVGVNGIGKSTLMKIVYGSEEPDSGKRVVDSSIEIAFLPQQPKFEPHITVREAIESELKELKNAQKRYEVLSEEIAENPDSRSLLEEHSRVSAYLDHHNAWDLSSKIERTLQEFKLKGYENRAVVTLSGGEQKRVALSSLVLKKPDLLLLDEPTNHLDVYMVEFLENILKKERFTLLFISHDRYFIDNIATRVVEIENLKLINYRGGYSNYLKKRELRVQALQKEYENLLRLLRREEEWLNRGVKARQKRDQGRKKRVLELRERAKKDPTVIRKMRVELEREKRGWRGEKVLAKRKVVFEIENLGFKIGDKVLIDNFTSRILQGDRIAVVGANGSGKSTFLKLLSDRLEVSSGEIKRGVDIKIGYFDQQKEMLKDESTLIETFCPDGGDRVVVEGKNYHVYGYLKNFLFPKEYLKKKVGELSGGEKSRVALALLFTKHHSCLILDEPTNDLDIQTINILEEKLLNYQGAIIFASHDRYFVDKISQKLFIFGGEDGVVENSYRLYSEYLEIEKEMKSLDSLNININSTGISGSGSSSSSSGRNEISKTDSRAKKEIKTKLSYKDKRNLEILPQKIEKLESEIEKINSCLSNPDCYSKENLSELSDRLNGLEKEYEILSDNYLELLEKEEEINSSGTT